MGQFGDADRFFGTVFQDETELTAPGSSRDERYAPIRRPTRRDNATRQRERPSRCDGDVETNR